MSHRAVLLTPPLCALELPQAGPAMLRAFAARAGLDTPHIDLNVRFRQHLRERIELEVVENPGDQQPTKAIVDLLALHFTDRLVERTAREPSYVSAYLDAGIERRKVEQYQAEVGAGFGYTGVVSSTPEVLARFALDEERNYYHQFLRETGAAEELADRYDLVGFSIMGPSQVVASLTIAARLRALRPAVRVVLGGPWVSLFIDELATARPLHGLFDAAVGGEGEQPWVDLALRDPSGWRSIPNVWLPGPNGLEPPHTHYTADLAALPTPDFDGLDLDAYLAPRPVLLQTSRGCYWGRCAFCVHTFNAQTGQAPRVRLRPMERIREDVEQVVARHAPRFISFADVSISPARMKPLTTIMREAGKGALWFTFLRFENGFDRELLRAMREAGCFKLNFGLESGSQRVLERLQKGHSLDVARRIIDDAVDLGFRVTLHTMAGLPGETAEEVSQTLAMLGEYAPHVHEAVTEIFRLERGTRIFADPTAYDIDIAEGSKAFDNAIAFDNRTGVTQEQAARLIDDRLYPFYRDHDDLLYRSKSTFALKHKDDFPTASRFRAVGRFGLGGKSIEERCEVETRGGGILRLRRDSSPS